MKPSSRLFCALAVLSIFMKKVYSIDSVLAGLDQVSAPVLVVYVRGHVTSGGWSHPQLLPWSYISPPVDGIYDFDLVATAPVDINLPALELIEAAGAFANPPEILHGIRIHASNNFKEALITGESIANLPEDAIRLARAGTIPWPRDVE